MLVAIDPGSELALAVVEVEDLEAVEADDRVELTHGLGVIGGVGERVPGGEDVAGVEADAELGVVIDAVDDVGEMLEAAPQVGALAGRRLEAQRHLVVGHLIQQPVQSPGDPVEAGVLTGADMRSRVEHQVWDTEEIAALYLCHESLV